MEIVGSKGLNPWMIEEHKKDQYGNGVLREQIFTFRSVDDGRAFYWNNTRKGTLQSQPTIMRQTIIICDYGMEFAQIKNMEVPALTRFLSQKDH